MRPAHCVSLYTANTHCALEAVWYLLQFYWPVSQCPSAQALAVWVIQLAPSRLQTLYKNTGWNIGGAFLKNAAVVGSALGRWWRLAGAGVLELIQSVCTLQRHGLRLMGVRAQILSSLASQHLVLTTARAT